jgi:phage-related minor tail protein
MPNTKAVGVAFADPEFESVTVSGAVTASGAVTGGSIVSTAASGAVASNANAGVYILSTAITANTTTTSVPVGSLGITTNATGRGKLFYSDGSKWQFMAIS